MTKMNNLFSKTSVYSFRETIKNKLLNEIEYYDERYFLETKDIEKLIDLFVNEKKNLIHIPRLHEIRIQDIFPHSTGVRVSVSIKFSGDAEIFDVRPHQWTFCPPQGTVSYPNDIHFEVNPSAVRPNEKETQIAINKWISDVKQCLQQLNENFRHFNEELRQVASDAIRYRCESLHYKRNLMETLRKNGI